MSTSICGKAFLSLFFISLLPMPLLLRSSTLSDLLVLRQPTIPSTAFSVILFPCMSRDSIWVSHTARTTCPIPSSVRRFLARFNVRRWWPWFFRHFAISAECMSDKSIKFDKCSYFLTFVWQIQLTLWCRLCLEYRGHIIHLLFDTRDHTCVACFIRKGLSRRFQRDVCIGVLELEGRWQFREVALSVSSCTVISTWSVVSATAIIANVNKRGLSLIFDFFMHLLLLWMKSWLIWCISRNLIIMMYKV